MSNSIAASGRAALVSRPLLRPRDPDQYLRLTAEGAVAWTADPQVATAFPSMREAARAAIRLPGAVRAFAVPAGVG